jgi:hypothetical protein
MPELRTRLFIGIANKRSDKVYRLTRLPTDPGCLAWEMSYTDPVEGEVVYQVHRGPDGAVQCDCKGHRMHEQQCRHIRGLIAEKLI